MKPLVVLTADAGGWRGRTCKRPMSTSVFHRHPLAVQDRLAQQVVRAFMGFLSEEPCHARSE
jgi:hypothetical protein